MSETLLAALFAFAIQAGGYADYCKANECKAAPLKMVEAESPHMTGSGLYMNGNAVVKDRGDLRNEITYVHEQIHHLQRLSNRYHHYRGICNKWGAEREAYEGAGKYARTKGVSEEWIQRYVAHADKYKETCEKAVAAGLVNRPAWMTK